MELDKVTFFNKVPTAIHLRFNISALLSPENIPSSSLPLRSLCSLWFVKKNIYTNHKYHILTS
jgi:hypothetical protein